MVHCDNCGTEISGGLQNFCNECGEELQWAVKKADSECPTCKSPVSSLFNFCFACGEDLSPDEWLDAVKEAPGFSRMKWECDNEDCEGTVQLGMAYCPSCGEQQTWDYIYGDEDLDYCGSCGANVSEDWSYCIFCGEEIDWDSSEEEEDEEEDEEESYDCPSCGGEYEMGPFHHVKGGTCYVCGEFVCSECLEKREIKQRRLMLPKFHQDTALNQRDKVPMCTACHKELRKY